MFHNSVSSPANLFLPLVVCKQEKFAAKGSEIADLQLSHVSCPNKVWKLNFAYNSLQTFQVIFLQPLTHTHMHTPTCAHPHMFISPPPTHTHTHTLYSQISSQLDTFRIHLEEFARRHKNDIRKDPNFRGHFQQMCARIGVDPLACETLDLVM